MKFSLALTCLLVTGFASAASYKIQCPVSKSLTGKFELPRHEGMNLTIFNIDTKKNTGKTSCADPKIKDDYCEGIYINKKLTTTYGLEKCLPGWENARQAWVFDLGQEDEFTSVATLYTTINCKTKEIEPDYKWSVSLVIQAMTSSMLPDPDFISKPVLDCKVIKVK